MLSVAFFIVILSFVMLNVAMLSVVAPSFLLDAVAACVNKPLPVSAAYGMDAAST
jgi:hypothetical protein